MSKTKVVRRGLAAFVTALALVGALGIAGSAPASAQTEQNGPNNWAGPGCPGGPDWNCTDDQDVVQNASGGQNVFVCAPGTTAAAAVQNNSGGGSNTITCDQSSEDNGTTLSVAGTQTTGSGPNVADVDQAVTLTQTGDGDVTQEGVTEAALSQANGSGPNTINLDQAVNMTADTSGLLEVSHSQEGFTRATTNQTSTSGKQTLNVTQDKDYTSNIEALQATQGQDSVDDEPGDVAGQYIEAHMNSGTGENQAQLHQDQALSQTASGPLGLPAFLGAFQRQGHPNDHAAFVDATDIDSGGFSNVNCGDPRPGQRKSLWFQQAALPLPLVGGNDQFQYDELGSILGKLSPHTFCWTQEATLQTDGGFLCIQDILGHAKIVGSGSQSCNGEGQTASGTTVDMELECGPEGCGTTNNTEGEDEVVDGDEGCGIGYYKQPHHFDSWYNGGAPDGEVVVQPGQRVKFYFTVPGVPDYAGLGDMTLLEALNQSGGPITPRDSARLLLKQATAALNNALYAPDVLDYPRLYSDLRADVDGALASLDQPTMNALQQALNTDNGLGCPLP